MIIARNVGMKMLIIMDQIIDRNYFEVEPLYIVALLKL